MGGSASLEKTGTIYVRANGRTECVVFSRYASSADIRATVRHAAKCSGQATLVLTDEAGVQMAISPDMHSNTRSHPLNVLNVSPAVKPMKKDKAAEDQTLKETPEIKDSQSGQLPRTTDVINEYQLSESHNTKLSSQDRRVLGSSVTSEDTIVAASPGGDFKESKLSQELYSQLKNPTFDVWQLEPAEMLVLVEHMYYELGIVEEFAISQTTLRKWLRCIRDNYKSNPFHNFRHSFSVAQMMYGMIHLCNLKQHLSCEDLGILLTGAVCHDIGHPGFTNTYQINAKTELAIAYNGESPLENYHCAMTFKILSNPETNIFANVTQERFDRLLAGIRSIILATDMARHADITSSLSKCVEAGFDFHKQDHVDLLKMVLLKCCDVSNEVRPSKVSEPMLDCLLEEYFNQSDKEKAEGLPVMPFMDRDKATKPMVQLGFIKCILIPLFELVAKIFPAIGPAMLEPLRSAKDHYEALGIQDDKRNNKAEHRGRGSTDRKQP